MGDASSFDALAQEILAGSPSAASAVYQRFAGRLIALARSRLDRRLRGKVDPEDVVQSALRSFFLRAADGQFSLPDREQLWALLVLLTLRKCHRQAKRHFAARRDVRREASPADEGPGRPEEVTLDREPTAEEAVCLTETVEQLMARLSTSLKRRVLEMSLQGYSAQEIAEALNYYERGVRRIRAEVRELLTRPGGED